MAGAAAERIRRLATNISECAKAVEAAHSALYAAIKSGDATDDGNGAVEEAAGDTPVEPRPAPSLGAAQLIDAMRDDITAVRAYAKALSSMSLDDDMQDCFSDPLHQLASDIGDRIAAIEQRRDEAWRAVVGRAAGDVGGEHEG